MGSHTRAARERKRHGRHYTPPMLARFLARRLLAHMPRPSLDSELRVLDPACGDGELLLALHREAAACLPGVRLRLTGYDLDEAGLAVARTRAMVEGVRVDWRAGDFLSDAGDLDDGSFDAIITNPPYVRTQQLGGATAQLLSRQYGLRGRIDLTHPFVAVASRLLTPGGALGLLCANRFLTTKAGANIRAILLGELSPVELYDLGDTKLFAAAVLPAVTIATRGRSGAVCRHVSAYEVPFDELLCHTDLFEALIAESGSLVRHNGRTFAVEVGTLATGASAGVAAHGRSGNTQTAWRMSLPSVDSWLARVGAGTWRSFGEVARIRVGIKTTADRVFISDRWAKVRPRPEDELLLELITHHDLAPWRIERAADTRVLYPYDTAAPRRVPVDLREFPGAAAYLRSHEPTLAARKYLTESGREWFEIWVPQRPNLWRVPKLVFPDISERPRFALDRSGAVVNGDCYWISLEDLGAAERAERLAYLLMGVANSALGLRYYDAVCGNRLYSGRRRWITQYVSRLPLPDPDLAASREIAALVAELVDGDRAPDDAARHRLDELVNAAFGLDSGGRADADHRQQGAPGERATGLRVAERDEAVGGERQRERQSGHDLGDQVGVEVGVPGA
ncbi:Eco57I restriction-modification methylase domain-containing protein [Nocardia bhagyanarayanae]|uniref:site-specific DNA-methyltransferase (adenine-specific) n=1 Tax=Nocardia bhagyanarayanae TaxID=1215925 RepID=A0A543EW85_9NOCA|nr:TaqI restriction endonuclease [Nocardia bhagyanarayanae]